MIYIYRSTGERVAFLENNVIFNEHKISIGYVIKDAVYLNSGEKLGYLKVINGNAVVLRKENEVSFSVGVKREKTVSGTAELQTVRKTKMIIPVGWKDAL